MPFYLAKLSLIPEKKYSEGKSIERTIIGDLSNNGLWLQWSSVIVKTECDKLVIVRVLEYIYQSKMASTAVKALA